MFISWAVQTPESHVHSRIFLTLPILNHCALFVPSASNHFRISLAAIDPNQTSLVRSFNQTQRAEWRTAGRSESYAHNSSKAAQIIIYTFAGCFAVWIVPGRWLVPTYISTHLCGRWKAEANFRVLINATIYTSTCATSTSGTWDRRSCMHVRSYNDPKMGEGWWLLRAISSQEFGLSLLLNSADAFSGMRGGLFLYGK